MHEDFAEDFQQFAEQVQDELLAKASFLEEYGPNLGRPHVDALKGSSHPNMKELRFDVKKKFSG